jgi:hypothetical protein
MYLKIHEHLNCEGKHSTDIVLRFILFKNMNGEIIINVGCEQTLVWGLNSKSEQFVANLEVVHDGAKLSH